MADTHPFLSVVINTKNSAATLEATLQSVQRWAHEIVVMDMQSSDETVAIAKKYQAQVFSHPDVGYVEPARNAAIAKARGPWILVLDADETLPSSLKEHIQKNLLTNSKTDAYFLPRKNIIFGRWVHTGWWPDHVLRLFKKGTVVWSDEIHSVPQVNGTVERVEAREEWAIHHENYQTIDQFIDRAQKYGVITARSQTAPFRLDGTEPWKQFFDEVLRRYYLWGGYQDKLHGTFISLLQGWTAFLTTAYRWQEEEFPSGGKKPAISLSPILYQAARDARYWENHIAWQKSTGFVKLYWRIRMKCKI